MGKKALITKQLLKPFTLVTLSFLTTLSITALPAKAITLNRNFIAPGKPFPLIGGNAGNAPENALGGGNLIDIFNAAADWWEMTITDSHLFDISFGWAALLGDPLSSATQINVMQPGNGGIIRFDNKGINIWFLDSTPHKNEEYNTFTEYQANLGGGNINTGREYTNPNITTAENFDLLSVAKHEIGHLLGVANLHGGKFGIPNLTITEPLPYAGTVIPTTAAGGGHINLPNALMRLDIGMGVRRLQADVDILAVAQVDGFTQVNLNPAVPEPLTIWGVVTAVGFGAFFKRKLAQKNE